jgi:hypothetical protein
LYSTISFLSSIFIPDCLSLLNLQWWSTVYLIEGSESWRRDILQEELQGEGLIIEGAMEEEVTNGKER